MAEWGDHLNLAEINERHGITEGGSILQEQTEVL